MKAPVKKQLPGHYHCGRRTMGGVIFTRKILPVAQEIIEWIESNYESSNVAMTRLYNDLLVDGIRKRDPKFKGFIDAEASKGGG